MDAETLTRLQLGTAWLRGMVACGLLVVAVTEKLANVPMTAQVLREHPHVDLGLVLGTSPEQTVLMLGAVAVLALLGAHVQTADLVTIRPPWMRSVRRTPDAARQRLVGARVPWVVAVEPAPTPVAASDPQFDDMFARTSRTGTQRARIDATGLRSDDMLATT